MAWALAASVPAAAGESVAAAGAGGRVVGGSLGVGVGSGGFLGANQYHSVGGRLDDGGGYGAGNFLTATGNHVVNGARNTIHTLGFYLLLTRLARVGSGFSVVPAAIAVSTLVWVTLAWTTVTTA